MCASINNKNCNYKPRLLYYSFITQNHLFYGKTHREKNHTQGKLREFYLGWNVATLGFALSLAGDYTDLYWTIFNARELSSEINVYCFSYQQDRTHRFILWNMHINVLCVDVNPRSNSGSTDYGCSCLSGRTVWQ